ncbi:MAG: hypothetical protein ACI94Y_001137 [Maribacter sp.]|jgi:hypothetical protein
MAKSNRKRKLAAQNKKEGRQILIVVGVIALLMLVGSYLYYRANS